MKTSHPFVLVALSALSVPVFSLSSAQAQGSLTPPGSPAPTMKSLQEIWDRAVAIESQNQVQQQQLAQLQKQNDDQDKLIAVLLEKSGVELPWLITTVDGNDDVGQDSSLAYSPSGQPAISYYDVTNANLKYAAFDGSSWQVSTVDGAGMVGRNSKLAFSPSGQPAISYEGEGILKFATYNGSAWQVTTVGPAGEAGGLGFNPAGQPTLGFVDTTHHYFRHAVLVGGIWEISDVFWSFYYLYDPSAVVYGKDGLPVICCIEFDEEGGGDFVECFRHDGSSWQRLSLGGAMAYDVSSPVLAPNGQPSIAGSGGGSGLKLFTYDGTNWGTVDDAVYASAPSLAYSPGGKAAIGFNDTVDYNLKYAVVSGSVWQIGNVDTVGATGLTSSLAFTPGGQPSLSYYDGASGDLKFAVRSAFGSP